VQATIFAVLARNGVEDLHSQGAFDDSQAPDFNRLMRQELYAAFVAVEHDDDAAFEYLGDLAEEAHPEAPDARYECLTGAAGRAVWLFADLHEIDDGTAADLADAAQLGVLEDREMQALRDPMGAMMLMSFISDWEPPELSDEFRRDVLK
jgi:hypothetical protein